MKTALAAAALSILAVASLSAADQKAEVAALIEELVIPTDESPLITIDNPDNAAMVERVFKVAAKLEKYELAAFPQLLDSMDDQRPSAPFRRVLPSTVGDACFCIMNQQIFDLPEGYSGSYYREDEKGVSRVRPYYAEAMFTIKTIRPWLESRRDLSLAQLRVEAMAWMLAKEQAIGARTEQEKARCITPLEEQLEKLKKAARAAPPSR